MTQALSKGLTLKAPDTTPLIGTLFSAATVVPIVHFMESVGLFDSYNCMKVDNAAALPCDVSDPKDFDGATWLDGYSFAGYGGVVCKALSFDVQRAQSEVARVFEAKESIAVARGIMQTIYTGTGAFSPATDLTPVGGPVSISVGVALLEQDAAENYAGVPTIQVPRSVGHLLMKGYEVVRDGDRFVTQQGSKVASDAGYGAPNNGPTGAPPAAGTVWLYASGEIVVGRSDLIVKEAMFMAGQAVEDFSDNDRIVLAERGYLAAVDCYASAIRVTLA